MRISQGFPTDISPGVINAGRTWCVSDRCRHARGAARLQTSAPGAFKARSAASRTALRQPFPNEQLHRLADAIALKFAGLLCVQVRPAAAWTRCRWSCFPIRIVSGWQLYVSPHSPVFVYWHERVICLRASPAAPLFSRVVATLLRGCDRFLGRSFTCDHRSFLRMALWIQDVF